jgi:hypothetical protein
MENPLHLLGCSHRGLGKVEEADIVLGGIIIVTLRKRREICGTWPLNFETWLVLRVE